MENIKELFLTNRGVIDCKYKNVGCTFVCRDDEFGAKQIKKIISFINGVHKRYKGVNVPIYFCFGEVHIIDKLSYVIFECICYTLMKDYKHPISISWKPNDYILTQGVFSSPLAIINTNRATYSQKYIDKFEIDIYGSHFRKVVDADKTESNYVGELEQAVNSFLKLFQIDEDCQDEIVAMIGEVVGNAAEHAGTECLLDIDVTTNHSKSVKSIELDGEYFGINIVILNFSKVLFGDLIKERIQGDDLKNNERYMHLQEAYNYHSNFFSDKYLVDDFCNLASLQDDISGDSGKGNSGGKGLTKLIKSLQKRSDMDNCYLLTGKRIISFKKEYLDYDEERWLGLNSSSNFLCDIPAKDAIDECMVYFPGTAYNLNFILKRGE